MRLHRLVCPKFAVLLGDERPGRQALRLHLATFGTRADPVFQNGQFVGRNLFPLFGHFTLSDNPHNFAGSRLAWHHKRRAVLGVAVQKPAQPQIHATTGFGLLTMTVRAMRF